MKIKKINILYFLIFTGIVATTACSDDDSEDLGALPVASFTTDISSDTIEVGESVTFISTSENDPYLFKWTINGGDPTYSNNDTVSVEFVSEGSQAITLKVRNDAGADEITEYINVTPLNIPDLDITALVKMRFENNIDNEGSVGGSGTGGSGTYEARSKYGGTALQFTGSKDVQLTDYTGINGADPRTVACWIKTDYTSTSGLVHWGNSGTRSRASFKFQKTGQIRFEYQGGGLTGVTKVNDSEWHHVAYSYDGTTIRLYVDGVEDATASATINTGVAGETPVYIGSQLGKYFFKGLIDDVRIYDQALSADDIKFLSEII